MHTDLLFANIIGIASNQTMKPDFRPNPCRQQNSPISVVLVAFALAIPPYSLADESVEFNSAFFHNTLGEGTIDISRFNEGNVLLPGNYRADIYVNDNWVGREDIRFEAADAQRAAQLCLDRSMLIKLGIDIDGLPTKVQQAGLSLPAPLPAQQTCKALDTYVPGASADFDSGEGRLDVQVPQLFIARTARGFVSPEYWSDSINAAFINYNVNSSRRKSDGDTSTANYLGLRTGINLGAWNFRHNGSYSSGETGSTYQSSATYVQRELSGLQSQLMAGEIYTSGEFFDSARLRGLTLATDDRMMPDSMTGFAPIVRGLAETNARVTVRQRGIILDELTVAPGPFVLDDLYPTGEGGDLEVTITEADGRRKQFIVPFASNTNLLRPGYQRYSLSAGVIDELGLADPPWLIQGTYQRGLNNLLTGYVGGNASDGYTSQLVGVALNTYFGAVSFDLTTSQAELPQLGAIQGQSLRLRYNKNFTETGTDFALGAYRYSTDGFLTARGAAQLRDVVRAGGSLNDVDRLREHFEVHINQHLGSRGSLYLTGSSQQYWNRSNNTVGFSLGYSNNWKSLQYSLNAQRSRDLGTGITSNQISLTLSMPLGDTSGSSRINSTLSSSDEQNALSAGLNGSWGDRNQLNYGVSASQIHSNDSRQASTHADVGYRGQYGTASISMSQGNGYESQTLDLSGGIVAHPQGVTLAPELGDTFGVVHAPDAKGALIAGGQTSRIDGSGYGVTPQLTPYRNNSVELDPTGMSYDVELKTSSQNIAPRAGSVVLLGFETSSGRALLIKGQLQDGSPLPFAADVYDASGASVGVVGQAGTMFVRTKEERGVLTIKWGKGESQSCQLRYDHAEAEKRRSDIFQANATCKPADSM